MDTNTRPLILVLVAIVAISVFVVLDKVTGDSGLAAIAGLVAGTFIPSPLTKIAEK